MKKPNTRLRVAIAATALALSNVSLAAVVSWDGGGDGVDLLDPLNWSGDVLPTGADLIFAGGAPTAGSLNGNLNSDAFRFADGANLTHTGGTLTIAHVVDTESSFPEFGPGTGTHTMSNAAAVNQTGGGLFIYGRGGDGTLSMSNTASFTTAGGLWLGMDGAFVGTMNDSTSISVTGEMQMARFSSPSSTLTMNANASLLVDGIFVMSDDAVNSGSSTLQMNGSNLSVTLDIIVAREGGTFSWTADSTGVSPITVRDGAVDFCDNGGGLEAQLLVDLSAMPASGDVLLIDKQSAGGYPCVFRGLPGGSPVANSGGRSISYTAGDGNDIALIVPAGVKTFDNDSGDFAWETATNWNSDGLPGGGNLVFSGNPGSPRTITLNSNQTVDAVRFNDGDSLTQTGGTLTVSIGGGDTESSFPEFGPGTSTYTMSGTAAYSQNDGGLWIMGRAGPGELFMSDDTVMENTAGEIWLGMDSTFVGNLSGNAILRTGGAAMQMARFGSPSSSLTAQDATTIEAGFFVMADLGGAPSSADLNLVGSGVTVNVGGLFMRDNAALNITTDDTGSSPVNNAGPCDLFSNDGGSDPELTVDSAALTASTDLTIINKTSAGACVGGFLGLAEGASVPGTNGGTITYLGGDGNDIVILGASGSGQPVNIPVLPIGFAALLGMGLTLVVRRKQVS